MNTQAATATVGLPSHLITASLTLSPSAHNFRKHTSNGVGWLCCRKVMRLSIHSHHFVSPIHVFCVEFDATSLTEFRSNDILFTNVVVLSAKCYFLGRNGGRDLTWRNRNYLFHLRALVILLLLSFQLWCQNKALAVPPPSHLSSNVHSTLVMAPDVAPLSIICIPRTGRSLTTYDAV